MKVVLATSNPGKVREAEFILGDSDIEIVSLPIWLGEVETGVTYLDNARLKAWAALRMLALPVLAEDAGLEVDALHGLPGVRSARFAGPDATTQRNNEKLLALLHDVPNEERTARFRAIAVLAFPTGQEVVGEGVFEGRIASEPRGDGGFGYDPLFIPAGESASAAELPAEVKNGISHRAKALHALLTALQH